MAETGSASLYRQLPGVDALLARPAMAALPPELARRAIREVLAELREAIGRGTLSRVPDVEELVLARAADWRTSRLEGVINATGVVLHTNLGRAPLAPEAQAAVAAVGRGYSNAELELSTGKRGGRLRGIAEPLRLLLGCEDAIAVNNNAAAVLLVLVALAHGREVVVSRGELVEIGGSFRVPDILAASGARMVEVGTTNRTRASDYGAAIGPDTALLLKVHRSNFQLLGFTEEASTSELAALGVPLVNDLGSGALLPGLAKEPLVSEELAAGASLVCFSGDKLVGGPQAGILAGRGALVQACFQPPLYRALRLDKLVLAALEATLRLTLEGDPARIPAQRMLREDPSERAEAFAARLAALGLPAVAEEDVGWSGGGALPLVPLRGKVVAIRAAHVTAIAERLRLGDPPVVPRVAREALIIDLRTVLPDQVDVLLDALRVAIHV